MMEQYLALKKEQANAILFFRMGDFYEMFLDDAILASRELGLTLTKRSSKDEDSPPLCGVPYHAAETYINKLIAKGYRVAIAEQIGDPKAKGLTKREIIKVVTPGTVLTDSALTDADNNYIVIVTECGEKIIFAGADISTGECFYSLYEGDDRAELLFDEIYRLRPSEILLPKEFALRGKLTEFVGQRLKKTIFTQAGEPSNEYMGRLPKHFNADDIPKDTDTAQVVALLLSYLHDTVRTDLSHLSKLVRLDTSKNLVIDAYTLRNLEIIRNLRDGGKKDTLFEVLDFTVTAMGSRLLQKRLAHPLINAVKIEERLDAVEEFFKNFSLRTDVIAVLKEIYDFERILTRVEIGSASPRDLVALKVSLQSLPTLKMLLNDTKSQILSSAGQNIKTFESLAALLERAIAPEPPALLKDGGVIKNGYDKELDEYRRLATDSKMLLQGMEEQERAKTGIKSLKIGFNRVFGYYIEVRNSAKGLVPKEYARKQTLVDAERYITEELKEFETKILGAQEKIAVIENNLFNDLREKIKEQLRQIQQTAHIIAVVDVLASMAEAAENNNYIRPSITADGCITIKDGRHPLVERILTNDIFVPNDTSLNHRDAEIALITGPNMAGKSTYMRQVALITLMAQAGSFVPAKEAAISPVDRIFTRIGASDDLSSGQSTFMVEMNEVAQILKYATKNSLVILDEVGRGTSTFDGMSIARAVIEHIEKKIHAKTLFATHYHELTDLQDEHIRNFCIAVKERGKEVVFLRRIIKGAADKSYGIHVAKLAGLPQSVIKRAEDILAKLENDEKNAPAPAPTPADTPAEENVSLFASPINERILSLDVMSMTPLEALNTLYKLQEEVKQASGY